MKKILIILAIVAVIVTGWIVVGKVTNNKNEATQVTATVTSGTLINSISATGSITAGNTTNISTKASGTVTKVYVKNGDLVKKGQTILGLALDSDGVERRSSAWSSYLQAKEAVVSKNKEKQDLSITIWGNKQAILDAEKAWEAYASSTTLTDAERHQKQEAVTQARLAFDVNAEKLANADAAIAAAKISQQAAYLDYQDVSGAIIAPASGIINNLTLTPGSTLAANSSQSTTTGSSYASSQTIGFIRAANNEYQAKVTLTETDVVKVAAGQKVNITMDAHSDKTFTGKVLAVDVSGSSTSGVSSYPATIVMDPTELPIYPNMSVSATIIITIQTDVLLVPTSAITTSNGASTVRVIKDNKESVVSVELGDSNDTQTIVKAGLTEGDSVITGSSSSVKNSNSSSAFSSSNRGAGEMRFAGPGL